MTTIDKIRAEIERMHQQSVIAAVGNETDWLRSRIGTLVDVMDFLHTLEEPVSDCHDLEEAADEWCKTNNKGIALCADKKSHYLAEGIDAFKAGAEWQKAKMMEGAEECELYWDGDFLAIDLNMRALGYSERDKVKIIIVKEGEK